MAVEDSYIEGVRGSDEERDERREEGGNGSTNDNSQSSEDITSKNQPGIIKSKSQFKASASSTTSPKGSTLMPSNNIRHITLDASRPANNGVAIHLTQKPSTGSGSGYDEAINLTDTTGDGINYDTFGSFGVNILTAVYTASNALTNSEDATQRTYDVTFSSGIVRSFTLTIPGKRQSFEFLFGTTGNYLFHGETSSCNLGTNVNWTAYINTNSYQATVSSGSIYHQYDTIMGYNQYYNGVPAGCSYNNISSSDVLKFETNTEQSGSLTNNAAGDGLDRGAGGSFNQFSGHAVPNQTNSNQQQAENYIVYLPDGYGPFGSISSYNWRESSIASLVNTNISTIGTNGAVNPIGYDSFKTNTQPGLSPAFPFTHNIIFSENLQSCADGQIIDACNNPNSLAYIGYNDYEDCSGVAISSAVYTNSNTTYTNSCCPDCNGLALTVTSEDPSTPSGTDGVIELSVDDGTGTGTGTANYTFVIEPLNSVNAGKGAGTNIGSGAVSNITFTFGFQTDLAQDNLNTTANPTYATSSLTGNIPAVTSSGASTQGLEAGQYNVYVFDSSTTVCLAEATVTLVDPPLISGCMDSNSLTYDASANSSNIGACWYCTAATGLLENGNNTPVGGSNGSIIQASSSYILSHNAITTADTTVDITINALPDNAHWYEVLQIVDASSGLYNGQTKIELYKWDSQLPTGNSNFGTLTGFNAGTTQVGSTISQEIVNGGNFNTVITNATIGATFTYGYYSVKFYVVDPEDSGAEVGECYAIMDIIIPAVACENDPGVGIAQDGSGNNVLIADTNLYIHDPAICLLVNNFCCTNATLALNIGSPVCSRTYTAAALCTDNPYTVEATVQYRNSSTGGVWAGTGIWHILTPNTAGEVSVSFTEASLINAFGSADYKLTFNSFYTNSDQCATHTNVLNIAPPLYGCTDPAAINYVVNADCDDGSCIMPIYGCTDPLAFNYDPTANTDDGSCIPIILGCTDPTAFNYNINANTNDGSCIAAVLGCTDPAALNTNALANTDDGSCFYCTNNEPIVTFAITPATAGANCVSNADGSFTATVNMPLCSAGSWSWDGDFFTDPTLYANGATSAVNGNLHADNYSVTITDCYGCTTTETVSIPTDTSTCGCTDPVAENYCATCTIDDGTCLYCGCDDPNATNYNPNAFNTCSPNPCTYYLSPPPCIPPGIDSLLNKVKTCISVNGFEYYNKLVTGLSDDCSIMNAWKLILIDYLLNQRGLPCVYNCADANTPDASEVYISCEDRWITGGPHTGLNDVNTSSGVGTTSTAAMFTTLDLTSNLSTNGQLFNGDVIKHHTSGNIWIFNGPPITNGVPTGAVSVIGLDPETASGTLSGYWEYCSDSLRYTENTYNTNYLDNFTNFVNTFCTDCGNQPQLLTGSKSNEDMPDIQQGIDGIDGLEI